MYDGVKLSRSEEGLRDEILNVYVLFLLFGADPYFELLFQRLLKSGDDDTIYH